MAEPMMAQPFFLCISERFPMNTGIVFEAI